VKLSDVGEFGFIERIRKGCVVRPERVVRAIGDDASAFRVEPGVLSLVTTDLLVERVHFLRETIDGYDLGYKALAVNLSDIAAMGGEAREAFVSIAIPEDGELEYLEAIYSGMRALGAIHGVNILGGDTTASKTDLVINVAVYGVVSEERMMTRDAARPGDLVFATGDLGDSRAGLSLILEKLASDTEALRALLHAHRRPEPHLPEGKFLAAQAGVRAGIDVSDGLSSDLAHIAQESRVGAVVYEAKLPLSLNLIEFCERFGRSAVEYALTGGEDYALLVTVNPAYSVSVARAFEDRFYRPLRPIGEIVETPGVTLVDRRGIARPLAPSGWDHFRSG